ncbi:multiprotein-bridging factor 1 family protein [Streptomyces sp. NBC_01006]|uniref:helix-turn-helix domain-containing protein n=1 Tax=Streptomyces sp. NBC_01006 TaxID=2903716 RepID=UPI00386F8BFA|nr:helix-turn-helix transcriptional regulator [Streptomyces sp. NBC_01006]
MSTDPLWSSRRVLEYAERRRAGSLIRVGRQARGWRQRDLGIRLACSQSTVSRLEQDRFLDLPLLKQAAAEVGVPVPLLNASLGLSSPPATRVIVDRTSAEEDPMRRRPLITAAALAVPLSLMTRMEAALASTPEPSGAPARTLDARLTAARGQFDAAAHAGLLRTLPSLLADAHQAASETRRDLDYARLSSAYTIASQLLNKLGQYKQSRLTADRATLYAEVSGSPLAAAAATRELAAVLRHQGQEAAAQGHIEAAVARVEATGLATDAQASAFAQMLCSTAYTAAIAGDRDQALVMIREAARAARDLPDIAPAGRLFPVTPAAVDLYAVGVHWALGDAGTALEAGRKLHADQFPTIERKGRMHTDLARAWWQRSKPEQTVGELLAAARLAPGEVRDRPAIRQIVDDLYAKHPRVSGVRELVAVTAA